MFTADMQYLLGGSYCFALPCLFPWPIPPSCPNPSYLDAVEHCPRAGNIHPNDLQCCLVLSGVPGKRANPWGGGSFGPTWWPGMCHVGCKVPCRCPQRALLWPAAKGDDGQSLNLMGKHGFLKWCHGSCQVPRCQAGWALTGLCRYEEHHCLCRAVGFMLRASSKEGVELWSGRLIPCGSWDCTSYLGSWKWNSDGISSAKGTVASPHFSSTTRQCLFYLRKKNLFELG